MAQPLTQAAFGAEPARGFVETPDNIVDLMVDKLFYGGPPERGAVILDPGCGYGAFIAGIIRWCTRRNAAVPRIVGIEADPARAHEVRRRFRAEPQVEIREQDFLVPQSGKFEYIIGNPPYVSIGDISPAFRTFYRQNYLTATGRFDLYLLFFEQALGLLKAKGRLVFITPEKFLYVETARALRRLLQTSGVEELHFLDEQTFGGLVTYPLVTTITAGHRDRSRIKSRSGDVVEILLPPEPDSWLPAVLGKQHSHAGATLADICLRISCGVATGADEVFLMRTNEIPGELRGFAHPTIAGREIVRPGNLPVLCNALLVPYDAEGRLVPEAELGPFRDFLLEDPRRRKLEARTCVPRKPWYAFHENPPMRDILRPKLLCKDIGARATFVTDRAGSVLPRHSVYYAVPKNPELLSPLAEYLNSPPAQEWLTANCQRAANGFIRVQSHVLKQLPLPSHLAEYAVADATAPALLTA